MTFSNSNFYIETSAVNFLADKLSWRDAIATKGFQSTKGNLWYLSPVTIWEILLTEDKERRERIIYFSQHLFHNKLINSPSEFIVNYILAGCPLAETRYDFHSKLEINQVWDELCRDKRKTFVYDHSALKHKMKMFHMISKQLDKVIHRVVLDITVSDHELTIQQFVNYTYSIIKNSLNIDDEEKESIKVIKISILFAFYIICAGIDLDTAPQDKFWKKVGIEEPGKRLVFLLTNYKELLLRGPIHQIALMAYHQISSNQKSNRGLFMDCLHSVYITYADIFVTSDAHFKNLRERNWTPFLSRLVHVNEMTLVTHQVKIHDSEN